MDAPIKLTKLLHGSLFPTNFEKQKVSLAVNVLNEKTVAELTDKDTKVMVENVTKMWLILNAKTPSDGKCLNDEDRLPVSDINDPRLSFLTEIGDCFKSMESQYTDRVCSLTMIQELLCI